MLEKKFLKKFWLIKMISLIRLEKVLLILMDFRKNFTNGKDSLELRFKEKDHNQIKIKLKHSEISFQIEKRINIKINKIQYKKEDSNQSLKTNKLRISSNKNSQK